MPVQTGTLWSREARLLRHPFRAYRALARGPDEPFVVRPLLFLLALGVTISLVTAGRVVVTDIVLTMLFWSFVPALCALACAASTRLFAPRVPIRRALGLYFAGMGPWVVFLALLAALCLFAPDVYAAFSWLVQTGILPGLLLVTWLWAGSLTYAFFRAGLDLPRRTAILATALFYVLYVGSVVGYYLVTNQIQPQLFGVE